MADSFGSVECFCTLLISVCEHVNISSTSVFDRGHQSITFIGLLHIPLPRNERGASVKDMAGGGPRTELI